MAVQEPTLASAPEAPTAAADFLLELGTEELPPAELDAALAQLQPAIEALLAEQRLTHNGVRVRGTPRRLAVQVAQLAAAQEATTTERRGPKRGAAFDEAGAPTKALLGFCRGAGVEPDAVFFRADKKARS